jgi:hypothetical protein
VLIGLAVFMMMLFFASTLIRRKLGGNKKAEC